MDGFKVVFIDDNDLRDAGLNITPTKGVTQIEEYADLHRDVDQLKVRDLVALAEIVLRSVWKEDTQDINAEGQLALWILQQIDMGKLKLEDLDKNFRVAFSAKIKKLINKNVVVYKELNDELRSSLEMQWKQNKRKTTCKFEMVCPQYGNTPKSD